MERLFSYCLALFILLTLASCVSTNSALESKTSYSCTLKNFGTSNIRNFDVMLDKYLTGGVILHHAKGESSFSLMPRFWPKQLKARWRFEGKEGWREQELDLPPRPVNEDGSLMQRPYLCIGFFEDRVVVFTDGGSCMSLAYHEGRPPYEEFERRARLELQEALAQNLPGARIVSEPTPGFILDRSAKPKQQQDAQPIAKKALPEIPQCKTRDECVNLGILENAVFAEICDQVFPESKKGIQKAFNEWSVLKLDIPGLDETLKPDNTLRKKLIQRIEPYLTSVPKFEADIECSARYQMMIEKEPTLTSDAAGLQEVAPLI